MSNFIKECADDFNIGTATVYVSGAYAVIENVKRIILMSENIITIDYGKGYITVNGENLLIESLGEGCMRIKGNVASIEFS